MVNIYGVANIFYGRMISPMCLQAPGFQDTTNLRWACPILIGSELLYNIGYGSSFSEVAEDRKAVCAPQLNSST